MLEPDDMVVCLDDSPNTPGAEKPDVEAGAFYTITKSWMEGETQIVCLKERPTNEHGYYASRFRRVGGPRVYARFIAQLQQGVNMNAEGPIKLTGKAST